jgi:hypothetical protein
MNIKEELTCKYCNEVYKNPITLNCCGENICKQHVEELTSNNTSKTFACPLCNEENENQKLNVNKCIQKMLENELHHFQVDSKYKESLADLRIQVEKLEAVLRDPENVIYLEIAELKRQVDLGREKLKIKIDELADDLIQQLESYEKTFKAEYKENVNLEHYYALVEASKKLLAEHEKCLSSFSAKAQDREKQYEESEYVINNLKSKIKELKSSLFSDLSITYDPVEINKIDLFGYSGMFKLIIKVCLALFYFT